MNTPWSVEFVAQAKRFQKNLPIAVQKTFLDLAKEIKTNGPYRKDRANYGPLKGKRDLYHCHLEKGRPTYVACWEITNKKLKEVEIYYAGTHENAPY